MIKKLVTCSMVAVMAASLYGCGGGGDSEPTNPTPPPQQSGTQVISPTQNGTATAGADIFKLTAATTTGYEAAIAGGFKYNQDKISIPVGSQQPTAIAGGVNGVVDEKVLLTWVSNGKDVSILLTGLDPVSEGALESSAPDAKTNIYTTY